MPYDLHHPVQALLFQQAAFLISSAPEQQRMNEILVWQEGVLCHMDDILIFGQDQKKHVLVSMQP